MFGGFKMSDKLRDIPRLTDYTLKSRGSDRRLPICICLDTSYSMGADFDENKNQDKAPIELLKDGIKDFYNELSSIKETKHVEPCILSFNSNVEIILDYGTIKEHLNDIDKIDSIQADGLTRTSVALNIAVESLEKRKNDYKDKGIGYYQPWLVVFTDGMPQYVKSSDDEDNEEKYTLKELEYIRELEKAKKLHIIPIAVGDNIKDSFMKKFREDEDYLPLKKDSNIQFSELFEYLAQSSATNEIKFGPIKQKLLENK
jgi:uncharacterized protein YegL